MPDEHQNTSRISGGLLGVIALALAGSGAGAVGFWALGGDNSDVAEPAMKPVLQEIADNSVDISETVPEDPQETEDPVYEAIDGPQRLPADVDIIDPAPVTPAPRPDDPPIQRPNPPPISRPRFLKQAGFIVRFNDEPELGAILKGFRGNKEKARAEFKKWASKHPELSGLSLERVNYSGEAILSYRGADDAAPALNAKEIQARLNDVPFVRYADPDFTAFPGKGE